MLPCIPHTHCCCAVPQPWHCPRLPHGRHPVPKVSAPAPIPSFDSSYVCLSLTSPHPIPPTTLTDSWARLYRGADWPSWHAAKSDRRRRKRWRAFARLELPSQATASRLLSCTMPCQSRGSESMLSTSAPGCYLELVRLVCGSSAAAWPARDSPTVLTLMGVLGVQISPVRPAWLAGRQKQRQCFEPS